MSRFLKRWIIEGTLKTRTPLHIGDGETITRPDEFLKNKERRPVDISSVAVDASERAYLPATAIKGNLRSWAKSKGFSPELFDTIFGSEKSDDELNSKAGKVQFWNAYVKEDPTIPHPEFLPSWHPQRLTAVTTSIAVDRFRRTASDQKLFHKEFVPPGVTFSFKLGGNDYSGEDAQFCGENLWLELLKLLYGFNLPDGVSLGSETANLADGWGKLVWNLVSIRYADESHVKNWIQNGFGEVGYEIAVEELEESRKTELNSEATAKAYSLTQTNQLSFAVELQCLENFLVNDPSHAKFKSEKADPENRKPNHIGLQNLKGLALLPKSSVKGAVRSHAEKILRTMAIQSGFSEPDLWEKIACYPDNPKKACSPIKNKEEVKNLCLACQVFGASGWKSPFQASPFTAIEETAEVQQEFVAIDRFTGGGADGAKFNAKSFNRPILQGEFYFAEDKIGTWAIGILALTLRDLIEGDIRIGFGRAKGYGEILAKINNSINLNDIFAEWDLSDSVKVLEDKISEVKPNGIS